MKTIFIAVVLFFVSLSAQAQEFTEYMINDVAVTTSNDTLISGWVDISGWGEVELFVTIGDSIAFGTFSLEWDGGTGTVMSTTILTGADTLSTLGSSSSESGGLILRGYGTNIIKGAGQVRITGIRKDYSDGVTSSLKVILRKRR